MATLLGNTSTEFVKRNETGKDCSVKYILTNVASTSIALNIYMGRQISEKLLYRVAPKNLTLAVGESFCDDNICLVKDAMFKFTTTGSTDYYFSMETL